MLALQRVHSQWGSVLWLQSNQPQLTLPRLLLSSRAVVAGMDELQEIRAADENRGVWARTVSALQSWQPAFDMTSSTAGPADEAAASDAVRRGVSLTSLSSMSVDEL
jgi:hypothetical protein